MLNPPEKFRTPWSSTLTNFLLLCLARIFCIFERKKIWSIQHVSTKLLLRSEGMRSCRHSPKMGLKLTVSNLSYIASTHQWNKYKGNNNSCSMFQGNNNSSSMFQASPSSVENQEVSVRLHSKNKNRKNQHN